MARWVLEGRGARIACDSVQRQLCLILNTALGKRIIWEASSWRLWGFGFVLHFHSWFRGDSVYGFHGPEGTFFYSSSPWAMGKEACH